MATGPAPNAAAASTGSGPSAVPPAAVPHPGHAALPPVSDVPAELLTFPDETLWPALRDLTPEELMRFHDLIGSAFADRLGLMPLRFQNPPPDIDMEQAVPEQQVPPTVPDANMTGPPGGNTSDLLDLGDDGPPAPTTVPEVPPPEVPPPEVTRRSGYVEGGPLPNLGNQDHWNPAWLRQLDPSDLEPDTYDWVDVNPPLRWAVGTFGIL